MRTLRASFGVLLVLFFAFSEGTEEGVQLYTFVAEYLGFKTVVWTTDTYNPCIWNYVTCDANGNVATLNFEGLNLTGILTPNVGNLTHLTTINLAGNNISGEIPTTIGNLKSLSTLDLSHNRFSGPIPKELGSIAALASLNLAFNNLSGAIPNSLVPSLEKCSSFLNNTYLCSDSCFSITACSVGGHRNSPFGPPPPPALLAPPPPKKSSSSAGVIGGVVGGIVALGVIAALVICLVVRRTRKRRMEDPLLAAMDGQSYGQLKRFKLREMQAATDNFSPSMQLGDGGFGMVFKGKLPDGTVIAVKRLKERLLRSNRGDEAFVNELEVISRAKHRNVLILLGFCVEEGERLLIFPFMPNGSVADYFQDQRRPGLVPLPWAVRKTVALGSAQGLAYMHDDCNPRLIHLDVKAANILLAEDYAPVLADFGLTKLMDLDAVEVATQVQGTRGYIAPEYIENGQISDKTDVYGFGIFLLELGTGKSVRKLLEEAETLNMSLRDWVSRMLASRSMSDIVDLELRDDTGSNTPQMVQMFQVANFCIMDDPEQRPSMQECITMLQGQEFADRYSSWREGSFTGDLVVSEGYSQTDPDNSIQGYMLSGPR